MIIDTLRINQLSTAASDWYVGQYLVAMDSLDIDRHAGFLARDASIQFSNAPAVRGKSAVV